MIPIRMGCACTRGICITATQVLRRPGRTTAARTPGMYVESTWGSGVGEVPDLPLERFRRPRVEHARPLRIRTDSARDLCASRIRALAALLRRGRARARLPPPACSHGRAGAPG